MTDEERRIDWLPFEQWVAHVFDHPVAWPKWYFEIDAPFWTAPPALTIEYMTRLFDDPMPMLGKYSDAQLGEGFWYLVSNGGSNHMFALTDASAPLGGRVRCVESFASLFEKLFAGRCDDALSHLAKEEGNPVNSACYMWWDIIPFAGAPGSAAQKLLDDAALDVMEKMLSLDSVACRESALHGLGHWHHAYPQRVEEIVARALERAKDWPEGLLTYARSAQCGCVQ
jgi:hypothetical protein